MVELKKIATEQRNPNTMNIDRLSTLDMVKLINQEDHRVAEAVAEVTDKIAEAIDVIADRLSKGGRLIYCGAGTSGRLGILDAVECPPTYSTEPEMVQALMAGGYPAIF
jgi:N-acetylmuramic acid 6-phosphate etherase